MAKNLKNKCQCERTQSVLKEHENMYSAEEKGAMNHEPNKCEGWYKIKKYQRGGKILYLCSCCCGFGDVEII